MDDVLEPMTARCGDCRTDKEPAGWSYAWSTYLCFRCRAKRTDEELRVKLSCKPPRSILPADPALVLL